MLLKFLAIMFDNEKAMTAEDKNMLRWSKAIAASNWVLLYQLRMEEELDASQFFDKLAHAYAHCYAAGQEPKRDADWTAFKKVLENLHYPAFADAVEYRHDNGTGR